MSKLDYLIKRLQEDENAVGVELTMEGLKELNDEFRTVKGKNLFGGILLGGGVALLGVELGIYLNRKKI